MPSTRRLTGLLALLVLAGIAALTQSALAFQAIDPGDNHEILLPAFDSFNHDSYARLTGEQTAIRALSDRFGGQWRVYEWNPWSRTPRWIYGDGPQLSGAVTDEHQLEEITRQLIASQPEVFGATLADLRLAATPHVPGKWAAHYQQTYYGLDVWEAMIRIVVSDTGRLVLMGSDFYSGIDLDPTPSLNAAAAADIAKSDLPFDPATDSVEEGIDLLVLPTPLSVTEVEHHLVWRVRVHTENPLGVWVTHVDAHDGKILWRYNDVHFAYSGSNTSDVEPLTYCNGEHTLPAAYMDVTVTGVGTDATDLDGNWSLTGTGGNRNVTARFYGPYCNVYNVVGGNVSVFNGVVQENVPLAIAFNGGNARNDERDVFDAVNDIHAFFQLFAPEFSYPNNRINARVNVNECCNANWNGTINFFTECGGCANTGEIQDVVYHEYGHGIQAAILGWQGDEGLGEGNGDIIANLMTVDPVLGRGFYLNSCGAGIRNSDNNLVYPDNVVGQEVHDAGRVIAGFNWHGLVPLMEIYGELDGRLISASNWHYGRVLLHPILQPAQVLATFTADDDDGNLNNGTPHWALYAAAAERHGFTPPPISEGLMFSHTHLDDTMDNANPYPVSASITSTEGPINAASVKVFWRLNEGIWNQAAMVPSGMGNSYVGAIPAQSQGEVEYYLYAEDTAGNHGTEPNGAPWGAYKFRVAWLVEAFEQANGAWTVGVPTDNATSGIWTRVDPIGTIAQPENDHTGAGSRCWITGQHTPGQPDDYNDVDGGTTSLLSPVFDVSGAASVNIRFFKWFSNNHGSFPGVDPWRVWGSNDGGTTWTILQLSSQTTQDWTAVEFNLTDFFPVPDQLRLKFAAQDLGGDTTVEAGVDDLVIMAFTTTGVDDDFSVSVLTGLDQNVPNPFNPRTEIRFTLGENGPAKLNVFDASGRLVKNLASGSLPAGEHRVVWDGTDSEGRSVPTGVYFYRLETQDQVRSRQMVLLK